MSYQEKKTIINMSVGTILLAAYCLTTFGRWKAGTIDPNDLKFWAGSMLLFIGIGVAAIIITQIVFHILMSIGIAVRERKFDDAELDRALKANTVEDEMDQLIELKSNRIGTAFGGLGFVAALVSLTLNAPVAVMINILFLACSVGTLAEGFYSLHCYRKGI